MARKSFIDTYLRLNYGEDEVQNAEHRFYSFNVNEAVVWIDPLDGTSDFVANNLPAVTVLIGLSINGKSRAGVVHNPFSEEDRELGKTFFGTAEHGCYYLPYNKNDSVETNLGRTPEYMEPFVNNPVDESTQTKVAASLKHFDATMEGIINAVGNVDIVRLGGAGNKCNNIARGVVDTYMHPSPGLCYWDLCAPESLVKAMGGYATDLSQQRLTYHVDAPKHKLRGLILGRTKAFHEHVCNRLP